MLFSLVRSACSVCVACTLFPMTAGAQTETSPAPTNESVVTENTATEQEPGVADLKLVRVALHTSGKGYFEYAGEVDATAIFTLPIRAAEASDIIRTATVVDPAKASSIRFPVASDPIDPAPPSIETETMGDLLLSMRGQRVQIQDRSGLDIHGRLINIEMRTEIVDQVAIDREQISVLTEDGIRSLSLEDIDEIEVDDPQFRERLNRSLEQLARPHAQKKSEVEFVFGKSERREVRVIVIREVPIWKIAYFTDLAGLRLRTIVENTTDTDWSNVKLELATGNPMVFDMDLASIERPGRTKVNRPQPQSKLVRGLDESTDWMSGSRNLAELKAGTVPRRSGDDFFDGGPFGGGPFGDDPFAGDFFGGAMGMGGGMGGGGMGGGMGGGGTFGGDSPTGGQGLPQDTTKNDPFGSGDDPFAGFDEAGGPAFSDILSRSRTQSVPPETSDAGAAGAAMFIKFENANIPAGKMVLLDISIKPIEIGIVSVYRASDPDPRLIMCLEIENLQAFQLPAGPATVFLPDTGYAGDAIMPTLNPRVKRLVPFAVDQSVRVIAEHTDPQRKLVSVEIDSDKRQVRWVQRLSVETKYHIHNRDAKGRSVMIEHPLPQSPIKIVRSIDRDTNEDDATPPTEEESEGEKTGEAIRYESLVLPGQSRIRTITEQIEHEGSEIFISLGDSQLAAWLDDENVDDATKTQLRKIIELRTAHQRTRRTLQALQRERSELGTEIKRVSDQLRIQEKIELPATLKTRYQNRLVELEDQRDALTVQQTEFQETLDEQAAGLGVPATEFDDLFSE